MSTTYYVNLSAVATGSGTSVSPLNYAQLVNYFNPNYGTAHGVTLSYDVIFMLTGSLDGFYNYALTHTMFLDCALSQPGTFKFVGINPIVLYKTDAYASFITTLWDGTTEDNAYNSSFEFDNISFIVNAINGLDILTTSSGNAWSGTDGSHVGTYCTNLTFKNSYFKSIVANTHIYFNGWQGLLKILGCTFDCDVQFGLSMSHHNNLTIYDTHFNGPVSLYKLNVVVASGNTSVTEVSGYSSCTDTTGFIEPEMVYVVTLPTISDYATAVSVFSSHLNWVYSDYLTATGTTDAIRLSNDFVYDAWGNTRAGVGAFAFETVLDLVEYLDCIPTFSEYSTYEYYIQSSSTTVVTEFLQLYPTFYNGEIEQTKDIDIAISVDVRTGFSPFDVTFTIGTIFTSASDIEYVQEYNFYPDYSRTSGTYITYTTSAFTHTYAGYKGKTFDPAIQVIAVKYDDSLVSSDIVLKHNLIIAGFNPKEVLPAECITDFITRRY